MAGPLKPEGLRPFDRFALGAVCLALAVIFGYLTVFCLFHTSAYDLTQEDWGLVRRQADPFWLNLLLVVFLAGLVLLFLRFEKSIPLGWCTGIFLGLLFTLGMIWVRSISALPQSDALVCYNTAVDLASGRPISQISYYRRYPFQVGYTLYCELFVRLFGEYCTPKIGAANALLMTLSYAAILALLWEGRHSKRLQLCAIALLALLIQPVFYATFIYGTVPGLAFALWGLVLAQRWVRQKRWWQLPLAAALCAVAVLLKPNYWIMVVAILLVLMLYCISARHFRWLPLLLAFALTPMLAVSGAQGYLEARTGQTLGKGTPQTAWLAMGLQEAPQAPGWYNGYTGDLMRRFDFDSAAAQGQSLRDVRERLGEFAADPAYALLFFHDKMVSQWGETTYKSLWINELMAFTQQPPAFVQSVLTGKASPLVKRYMDAFAILLFLAFALGLVRWTFGKDARKRSWRENFFLGVLAVAVFGGWLYHMLFEANAQYVMIYLPMMVPFAAEALSSRAWPAGSRRR
ncbi:MAG: hypothetical protein VB099_16605 [Candidatus Limiplasma sp.]|nr:hypothetical protein [Candidatus Limiplasma sp.]